MGLNPLLQEALKTGVFPVTKRLTLGQFVTEARSQVLQSHRVTHVLNVSDATSLASTVTTFEVVDVPITDLHPIAVDDAATCIHAIHAVMQVPEAKLYVHCIAGQNRSPTILWLYLIACGIEPGQAKEMIVQRSPDAVPGHRALASGAIVSAAQQLGAAQAMHQVDPEVLAVAY